jgi:hypothetical protein
LSVAKIPALALTVPNQSTLLSTLKVPGSTGVYTFLGVWDTVGSLGVPGGLLAASNKEKFAFHDTSPSPLVTRAVQALAIDENRRDFTPTFCAGDIPPSITIQQVWFAGAHSDVGGGYKTRNLADIPLVWMARKPRRPALRSTGHACLIRRCWIRARPRTIHRRGYSRSIACIP